MQSLSGVSFVEIADADGVVVANTRDPARIGALADAGPAGRSWTGDSTGAGGRAVVAHVPVFGDTGAQTGLVVGTAAVGQVYPSLGESLLSAVPNLLTYLGLAGIVGIAGSLLVARRVKRQTLGLEPVEIRGLVENREAMLTGIKEGVLGLDLDDRVTLVNAEAHRMLGLPDDCIGRTLTELGVEDRLLDVLTGSAAQQDAVVFAGERILTLNRKPVAIRGTAVGSVTTMRDLTELRQLQQELGVTRQTTEALRAQAHEFANRLHTISGLLELEEYAEVLRYVKRLGSATQELAATVTERIDSPPLAALLIAKSSVAAERGIRLHLARHEPGRAARRRPRRGPGDRGRQPGGQRAGRRRAARRRRGRRFGAGGERGGGGRGPRLRPRDRARARRGGLHQRLHHQSRRRAATAGSAWR